MKSTASKAAPSPGRADKYPPPLMRFLRGSAGSRSRGRSGSSRAASSRKRTTSSSTAIDARHHPEPSSPKVTCIGQVRVRRSSSSVNPAPKKGAHPRRPTPPASSCYSFHFDLFPRHLPGCLRGHCRKLASLFRCAKKGPVKIDSNDDEDEGGKIASAGERFNRIIGPPAPPKNAFLLTRSSSAPQRSSYLGNRFWGSPLETEEGKTGEQEKNRGNTAEEEEEVGTIEIEQISRDNDAESRTDQEVASKVQICREVAGEVEEDVEGEKQSRGPVVLTRSKSEPASVWRERRLESAFSSSSSTHSVEDK